MKQEYITTIRSYAKHKLHKHIQPNETFTNRPKIGPCNGMFKSYQQHIETRPLKINLYKKDLS